MTDIWSQALQGLQPRLGSQTYDLWLRPIVFRGVEGDLLRLRAPSRFMKEWFEAHYLGAVLDEIRSRTSESYRVEIEVAASSEEHETTASTDIDAGDTDTAVAVPPPAGLSERYRFSTFIKDDTHTFGDAPLAHKNTSRSSYAPMISSPCRTTRSRRRTADAGNS